MSCPNSEDQWLQSHFHHQYPQSSFTDINSYDSNMMTTDSVITTSSSDVVLSPSHSTSPGNRATPSAASPKPIRRRSRVSKKTPTTLLNADTSNFRALVQQFTGRPSPPSVIAPGAQRGPVNISFGQRGFSADDHHQGFVSGSGYMPFGSGYDSHGYGTNPQQHLQYDQERYSYNNPTSYPNGEISDNFVEEGLQNIDDLDWGTISSSTTHGNDSHHFM